MGIRTAQRRLRPVLGLAAFLGLALTFASSPAAAQQWTPEQRAACEPDAMRLCNQYVPDVQRVSACIEHAAHVVYRAHTTAHGEGNEHLAGHGFNDVKNHIARIAGGGDVQKGQLIGPLVVVACGDFHGIPRIAQLDEIDAFDHATTGHVKAGNDALSQHKNPNRVS